MAAAGEIGDRPEAYAEVEALEGFRVYNQRQIPAGRRFRSRWPGGLSAHAPPGGWYLAGA